MCIRDRSRASDPAGDAEPLARRVLPSAVGLARSAADRSHEHRHACQRTRTSPGEAGCSEGGHALRHTYATRMIELAIDVPTVSDAVSYTHLRAHETVLDL